MALIPFSRRGIGGNFGVRGRRLPLIILAGGILGGGGGLLMQWFSATIHYPLNIGNGRPYASWPSFVPVSFELTILFAPIFGLLGMFALNGLPQPYHPVFNVPDFTQASRDRFFLCIEARDPHFDLIKPVNSWKVLFARGVWRYQTDLAVARFGKSGYNSVARFAKSGCKAGGARNIMLSLKLFCSTQRQYVACALIFCLLLLTGCGNPEMKDQGRNMSR